MEDTFNSENTFGMEDTYELDSMIGASPASASVLDIIAASSSRTLTKEASAEDREAVGEVIGNCISVTDVDLSILHPRWLWRRLLQPLLEQRTRLMTASSLPTTSAKAL